jgi:hypothetical protein
MAQTRFISTLNKIQRKRMNFRPYVAIVAAAGALSACEGYQPDAVSSSPPTVYYRVTVNDVSQTNVQAAEYCRQYGMAPQYQGMTASGTENIAQYSCVASAAGSTPYGGYTQPAPAVKCADWLHQSRPGGSDYKGPPVPGCPQR